MLQGAVAFSSQCARTIVAVATLAFAAGAAGAACTAPARLKANKAVEIKDKTFTIHSWHCFEQEVKVGLIHQL
ncbi:hypothetical protein [Duganella guangzhouensis]|uniref:hypothetical protein n=1 Tax=Duganella guangzhouensis TaxID=2666084 RepID=UPI001E3E4C15|nr:hypothetical protein [Duganella guangzhouensis]